MLFTSVGTDLNVSYAAQGNKVDFEIYGSELVDAINQAVESDNVVTPDSLEFTNGAIDKFETLFYGEGKVYEVYPQIDGGDMEAELRVFVRLPEDADDMYMVTGDEEVIFLYVNNGDETISCATRIIRSEDGEEKVKTTKRINVKSYEDKFGDEEVDIISKKDETVEETTAVEEKTQDTANDAASEETTAVEEKETEITDETAEAPEKETTEAAEENTEAETEEATEAEKETEAETEKETAEETEKETAEEKADAEGEVTASVSRHYAPVVAMKEDAEAAPEKETAEVVETEKETTEKETTEAVEKETAEAVETEKETTEAESKDAEVAETETEVTEETSETEETAEDISKEETAAESKENEETEATKETQAETSKEAETTAEVKEEETKKAEAATDNDLVGIGYCSTAKAYTTTVKALKALDDVQGLKVTYAVNPDYSARIIDGPRGVEEGDALVFGVKNQIGYAIESVTANGEILEADTTSENEDGSVTAWYNVPEVTEEQEIEVYMTETDEHPEFNAELTMEDGTIITLHAAEGVLPAGVTAEATVENELADALKEKVEAENEEGGAVKTVVVYDINLMLNGHKLDNTWSQNGSVEVTFSGSKIEEMSADAVAIEICALDDASLENPVAENLNVEHIATEDVADTTKDSVSFEAEHFTAYAMYSRDWQPVEANVKKGTFNLNLTNVEAAYAYFNDADSSASAEIIPVSESFTIDSFCSSQKNGYIVFFVKPTDGYLLTGTKAGVNGTRGDLYSLTLENFGNINSYPGIHALAAKAKDLGYMGCFGYSRYSNGPSEVNAPITVEGVKPSMSVSAVSSKTTGVKPGDELTFTITVTPSRSVENVDLTVEEVKLTDVKINGKQVSYGELVAQRNGTYVTTATYVVTNPDCLSGEVKLDVDAETTYSYSLQYKDNNNSVSYVNTTAAATASASTTCSIASKGEYSYVLDYQGVKAGMTYEDYPEEVKTGIPAGGTIYVGQEFNLAQLPAVKYVDDSANEGYWTLGDKWNFNNQQFEGGVKFTVKDENQRIVFTAIWTFHPYETIRYEVAMGKGHVDRSSETLNPTSGTVSGSTATPETGYELAGWYSNSGCTDASRVGIANTFVPSEIKSATYYAKFVPKKDVTYTVHYYIEGTTTSVAEDKVVSGQTFDSEVTENAQTVAGYDVVGENSQTFVLDAYGKEITFFYNAKTLSYTVDYLEKGTNKVLRDRKTVDGTAFGTKVEEDAVVIPGYTVDANKKTIEKLDYSHRSITFFYEENGEVVLTYQVEAGQESMGSVTTNAESVKPVTGTPGGSIADVKGDSYSFVNWTVNGKVVSTNNVLTPDVVAAHAKNTDNVFVPTTFVAHFQQKIVVTANSDTKTYDGNALTGTAVGYTYTGTVKTGDTLVVTLTGEQKDVGENDNHVQSVKVYRGTDDVTDEYAFGAHVDGKLEVTKATVTMKSASATKIYDGTPLTKTDEMIITGFADGEGVECYDFASQTNAGSISNTFSYRPNDNTKLSNYDIKPENIKYGTLTVNKITTPIIVTASRRSKPYDGTALTGENYYTVQGNENLVTGDRLVVELSGSITNVSDAENGTVTNKIAVCKVMRGDTNVTGNYTVETHDGTLTVTPRKITLTSATRQKAYDGTPLTDDHIEETSSGTYDPFVKGEGLVYHVTGSRLDEGTSDNTFTYEAKEGTDLANYDITPVKGKLTVTRNANVIVITANSASKMYDGEPLTNPGYTYTTGVLATGDELTATVTGIITDAGETANTVTNFAVMRNGTDVTKNYTFGESVPGTLKVTERKVTITSGSSSRPYNGQPLTNSDIAVAGDGFVTGEEPTSYNVTGTVTNVDKVKNTFTYELPAGVNPDNYIITKVEGDLEITPVTTKIQITADSDSKVYDGIALTKNTATYTQGILANGDTLDVTVEGAQLGKGESANTVTAYKVLNAAGNDVTKNYTFAANIPGTLTVTARPITITADSAEKEYDGTPLTKDTYQVTGDGLANGEEISAITIEGEQVEIGTSSNAVKNVTITKKAEAANARSAAELVDVTDNYDITLVPGELKVTNRYDLSYTVNYHYLDAKGNEIDVESVVKSDASIGEAIVYSDDASREYAGKTYALVRVEGAGKVVEYYATAEENDNVVDVYYGLDEIGTNPEKPTTPDGTPDMYQVVFRYISENPSYGTVEGAAVVDGYVMEVVTRPQKEDGSYDMEAEVYPQGNVTVTGIGNYTFNHWSDDDTNYASAKEIAGHGFKTDMTFVAHFSYDGGNNNNNNNGGGNGGNGGNNGGGTNNGGSGSGGGSSSSGSRGSVRITSGGPGDQTVTIDAEDVPLAGLPDLPASPVEIDDGEVPLAALPKTGQTTMKLTITMMFSGIFLALTAMSKKHKDEES